MSTDTPLLPVPPRPTGRRPLVTAFLLGGLAAFLLGQVGMLEALALGKVDPMIITISALIGLGLGLLRRGTQALVVIDAVLFSAYLLVAHSQIVSGPASRWVRADSLPAKPVDAVVVLSSSVTPDSSLDVEATERLLTALALMKRDAVSRLITTRTRVKVEGQVISSDVGQRRLISLAGMESGWTVVDSVYTTRDEAVTIARLLLPVGLSTIAVVTSPIHTRRACAVFEAVGFRVYCVPAQENDAVTWHPKSPGDRVAASRDYFYERLGMVKYRWKGWLRPPVSTAP